MPPVVALVLGGGAVMLFRLNRDEKAQLAEQDKAKALADAPTVLKGWYRSRSKSKSWLRYLKLVHVHGERERGKR